MSKELKLLEQQRNALQRKIRDKLKQEIIKLLDKYSESGGLDIDEMTEKATGKQVISQKDVQQVYYSMQQIRKDCEQDDKVKLLVCRNGQYLWAQDKETIDAYTLDNIENGLKKITRNANRMPKSYKYLGIRANPQPLIEGKLKQFGVHQIEFKGVSS